MKFNSTYGLWKLRNIEIRPWKFELLIIVFFFELFKYMLVFILQSVVFILWLLVIASSPSSPCPTLVRSRDKCTRELLKTYNGCNSRVISNLLTGDETWVHMFEPQRRADNKQWKRKDQKRPCIAKRTISSKKVLYAVFFNSSRQVPCPSGHTITGRFYMNSVLKKVKEFLQ